jgi:hypothetical protein
MLRIRSIAVAVLLLLVAAAPAVAEGMLLDPGRVLLLGEIHGTVESPAFVLETAQRVHREGNESLVALQMLPDEQPRIDAYLASKGDDAARRELLAGEVWNAEMQSGVGSRAMFDLIDGLRQLRADGAALSVVAFNQPPSESGDSEQRETAMAKRLLEATTNRPDAVMLVLTGNLHSRVRRGRGKQRNFRSMGWQLSQMVRDNRVVAIDVAHHGGQARNCDGATPESCGVHEMKPRGPEEGEWITLYGRIDLTKHHGWYYVGELHASPPARQSLSSVDAP